jgi:cytochrome c551/c552
MSKAVMSSARSKIVFATLIFISCGGLSALEIKLPPETAVFKQDVGAELANGQCLVCHSIEYVSTQPPMARAAWKASVQKMQQKYGAAIPDDQVEPLVDYLTRNYGSGTNGPTAPAPAPAVAKAAGKVDAVQLATKYGCFGCHNATMKIVGPAYRDIAAKYRSDADAYGKIDEQIHRGGSGKWGPIIMPPFPMISAGETKTLADWILGMK